MPKSSTGTWDDDPITLLCLGVLDGAVYGDTLGQVKLTRKLDNAATVNNLR